MNWKILMVSAALSSAAIVGCGTPAPAAVCGNMTCEAGETTASCASDCPAAAVCGDGTCQASESATSCADDCGAGETRTYVVSTIDTESPADVTMAYGFDLDDSVGGIAGQACTAAPDFTSRVTGEMGVDNQLSTVLPTLDMMIDGGVNGAIQEQIQGGSLLLIFEVSGINSFANDSDVMVHIVLGTPPAMLMTAGTGLAADQTFGTMMDLGTVSGSITAGRLSAETPTLPLAFAVMGSNITLTLRNVVVGGRISDAGGFTAGEFGAIVAVDDVVTLAAMFLSGVDRATIEALAMPDIDPDATGEHCDSISAGLGFESVEATLM